MVKTFKEQFIDSIRYNEEFVANLIAEYYGDATWVDFAGLTVDLVRAIKSWKFDSADEFQAHLEEFVIHDDRVKTAVMNAMIEGIEFFEQEVFEEEY